MGKNGTQKTKGPPEGGPREIGGKVAATRAIL